MRLITDIEAASGAPLRDVDNWLTRLELRTDYPERTRGRARRYTLENCLELAFLNALAKSGVRPMSAVALASGLVRLCTLESPREWLVFPTGEPNGSWALDAFDSDKLREKFPDAASYALIPVAQINRRVRAYFDAHAEEYEG